MPTFLRITTTSEVRLINLDHVTEARYDTRPVRVDHNPEYRGPYLKLLQTDGSVRLYGPEAAAAASTLGLFVASDQLGFRRGEHTDLLYLSGDPDWQRFDSPTPIRREPAPAVPDPVLDPDDCPF